MHQLLIVEDDKELNLGLCKALQAPDCTVYSCLNAAEARGQFSFGAVSLVLLDINLPDGNGLDLLREMKNVRPDVPVILLTANDTDRDIVDGLEQGADDYITKPFSLSVLRARVNTQLRKASPKQVDQIFHIDHFMFDFEHMQFQAENKNIELSKTEQKLLRLLVEHQGMILSREQLVDRIWTDGAEYVEGNALSVTVNRLRNKLGAQAYIQTVYGIGYRWGKRETK